MCVYSHVYILYICMHIHAYTHTHRQTHMHTCTCRCACVLACVSFGLPTSTDSCGLLLSILFELPLTCRFLQVPT